MATVLDECHRFYLERAPVRGTWVRLSNSISDMFSHHSYPEVVAQALAELSCTAVALADALKFEGDLIMQAQSDGDSFLKLLAVEVSDQLLYRGVAKLDEEQLCPARVPALLADCQRLVLTIAPKHDAQQYQSIVALNTDGIAAMLEGYLKDSQQVPSAMRITWQANVATALLLQKLPTHSAEEDEAWRRSLSLFNTLSTEELAELPAQDLLYRLFHEEQVRLHPARSVGFYCPCSNARVAKALRLIGEAECRDILAERGQIDVHCDYCNKPYQFAEADLYALFSGQAVYEPAPTRH
ncbi:MAG: 33 kDa chaperonin [Pseudomonadota bacterium]|jgi:molecular chaperone Hsp33